MSQSSFLRDFAAADGAPPTARQLYKAFVLLGSDFGYEESEQEIVVPGGRRFVGWEAWEWFRHTQHQWIEEEHQLVYLLGRLGAFEALAGVSTRPGIYYYWGGPPTVHKLLDEAGEIEVVDEVESSYLRVSKSRADVFQINTWRVHACCGFFEPLFRDRLEDVYFFADAPEFVFAIERLLEGQFGLNDAERRQAIKDYERAQHLEGILHDHKLLAKLAREEA